MNLINYEKLNTLEKLNIFIILRIFRKKVEKKKDNKGIKLINTFLKICTSNLEKLTIKKLNKQCILGFFFILI